MRGFLLGRNLERAEIDYLKHQSVASVAGTNTKMVLKYDDLSGKST